MGGTWVHRITEADPVTRTGMCANCGPVDLWSNGARLMCAVAKRARRGVRPVPSRNYRRGRHGMLATEAKALRDTIGACEICGSIDGLAVDHCHETKAVRGVLCRACNVALGFMKDDPSRLLAAAVYLEQRAA